MHRENNERRVLIVGAGISGLSLAIHLARRGFRVAVFEQEVPGYGPSGRSAGLLVTIMPDSLLDLVLYSRDFYRGLESEGEPPLLRSVKSLWIAPSMECFEMLRDVHEKHGLSMSLLDDYRDASRIADLALSRAGEDEVYALIEEYVLDVGSAINRLVSLASSLGVEIRYEKVSSVGSGFVRVGSKLFRGTVVVAAGAWSSELISDIRDFLVNYRCQIASIEGARPRIPIEDDVLNYYIVPVSPSRSNIGDGSNTTISDPFEGYHTDLEDVYTVIERYAERVQEAWEARMIQAWSAPCNIGVDGLPLVDMVDEDLYVVTGFDGAGISLAPGITRLLADEIAGTGSIPNKFKLVPERRMKLGSLRRPREPYDIC